MRECVCVCVFFLLGHETQMAVFVGLVLLSVFNETRGGSYLCTVLWVVQHLLSYQSRSMPCNLRENEEEKDLQ